MRSATHNFGDVSVTVCISMCEGVPVITDQHERKGKISVRYYPDPSTLISLPPMPRAYWMQRTYTDRMELARDMRELYRTLQGK